MLCARILRPPVHGAKLKKRGHFRGGEDGRAVVKDGDLIAVLHERRDVAEQALG